MKTTKIPPIRFLSPLILLLGQQGASPSQEENINSITKTFRIKEVVLVVVRLCLPPP